MDIAVFCSDAADTYQLAVVTALSREATSLGHRMAVFVTNVLPETGDEPHLENLFLQLPEADYFEASVVLTDAVVHRATAETGYRYFRSLEGRRCVSIGRLGGTPSVVVIENCLALRELLNHLFHHHGYHDYLFLLGPDTSIDNRERERTIGEFLSAAGPVVRSNTLRCDFRGDLARERVLEYLQTHRIPRAIVACNDGMALGALAALRELGLRCPEDVAVTGFDDVEVAALEYPSLTTVRQPLARLAHQALASLHRQAFGPSLLGTDQNVVPTELILRESCGCSPAGLAPEDFRRQLSRVQSLRTQEATLLERGSAFSLEINAALDQGALFDGLDRFCRSLSAGHLSVALFSPEDRQRSVWPGSLIEVYRHDGRTGGRCQNASTFQSIVFRPLLTGADLLPVVFLLHNQGRRVGLLSCAFPASWTGFFKLMAANLSTGLSRVELLGEIRAHSLSLEAAVDQRTRDLTEAVGALRQEIEHRKALERELERGQKALQTILDTQPLPLAILSRSDGAVRYFNQPFARLTGHDDPGRTPSLDELTLDYGASLHRADEEPWEGPYREIRLPKPGGGYLQVMAQKSELELSGEPCFIVGMMDLTRQKQLEQDLLTISESERERFGQELHDDVCQQLAALSMYTSILGQKVEARLGERLSEVEQLSVLIDGILNHVRALSRGLFPLEVGEQSLEQVFEQFLVRIEGQTSVRCHFSSNLGGRSSELQPSDDLHLFRILQEAVQNTLKYARASEVRVRLEKAVGQLTFLYEDNGVGLPAEVSNGVGLRSIRYRASQLGARLSVGSGAGGGLSLGLSVGLAERGKGTK